jgi:DNA-binding beta-propeller fold protein YncE
MMNTGKKVERNQLANGWALTPVGQQIPLGDLPLNAVVSADARRMAVTNNGQSIHSLQWLDVAKARVLSTLEIKAGWLGLALNSAGTLLYASGGETNKVWVVSTKNDELKLIDSLVLAAPWPDEVASVAGLSLDENRNRLYAVTKRDSSLYTFDLATGKKLERTPLGASAYTCHYDAVRDELYVSLWDDEAVAIIDPQNLTFKGRIKVGYHPNDLLRHPTDNRLFVACADENAVAVIDLDQGTVVEQLNCALYPDAPTGSTTNALALSPDGNTLYAANADNNALAVFDVARPGFSESEGFIPTGWYPTAVKVIGGKIYVLNGKGLETKANLKGPNPYERRTAETEYIARLFPGNLSVFPAPEATELKRYTGLVYANTPYTKEKELLAAGDPNGPIPRRVGDPSPLKYVFYIIKENRTYDQVLGDLPQGNGDPSLCIFPDSVSPNHHALATEFVLIDNYYVDAEVSADGHNWSVAAYATDYTEKVWPTSYGQRGGAYDFEGQREISYPKKGYIWDYCRRAGISYRTYGEFANLNNTYLESLKGHMDTDYPGYNLRIRDTLRYARWEADFDSLLAINAVPHFNTVRFGNDHTSGARLGAPTPAAMVADNDLAIGKFVEHLSQSSIWKESVVFITEDDAQNGPDHVDAHRSLMLIASPYTRRKYVESTMYSTAGALRTMELILGLPPMSQYDAAATPLYACFQNTPDLTGYRARPANIDLDAVNTQRNGLSELSDKIDLSSEDQVPDELFTAIIWKTVLGEDAVVPAPRRGAFIKTGETEKDED